MRNMAFSLTKRQLLNGTKDVTRRLGWKFLKPGDLVQAVEKSMGLKRGEKVQKLCVIEVVKVNRECLYDANLRHNEMVREGFPELTPEEFIEMFCRHMRCKRYTIITRIEFRRIDGQNQN